MKNSSRVLWKSSLQLLFSCWHSVAVFSHSLYFLFFFFSPVFTCRVTAGVSKGGKKLTESIEAMRKLTTTGWLVLLFCLETNAALSLLEKRGGVPWTLSVWLCVFYAASIVQRVSPPIAEVALRSGLVPPTVPSKVCHLDFILDD